MKALIYKGNRIVEYSTYEETPREDFEVKIQVKASGICGSDLHAFLGHDERRLPPIVLGHEVYGTVVEGDVHLGENVVVNPIVSCDSCKFCLENRQNLCENRYMIGMQKQGGFAEFMNIHKKNIIKMNPSLDSKIAALCEPTATAVHAVSLIKKSSFKNVKDMNVLVIGAGSIGLLCAILLKNEGCNDIAITEKNPNRQGNIKNIKGMVLKEELNTSERFDLVIDAVGIEQTRDLSVQHVDVGGTIMHIGLGNNTGSIDYRKITLGEIVFLGTYTYTNEEFSQAAELLNSCVLNDDLNWISEVSLKDGQKAFDSILDGTTSSAKIILTAN